MKRPLIISMSILLISLTAGGQNLFFIGENSYPSTKSFTLKSNSDEYYINDLNILFARDGKSALFGVSTKTIEVFIRGRLMIYLDNGEVITLTDQGNYAYVDKIASAAYYLTNKELGKMKSSNINTVRYSLENEYGTKSAFGGDFSASNKGNPRIDFPAIISEFFGEGEVVDKIMDDEKQNGKEITSPLKEGTSYNLNGRRIISIAKPIYDTLSEGIVVVAVTVDRNGKVTDATPGVKGSTTLDEDLLRLASESALKTRFEESPDGPIIQKGTITYHFSLK